MSELLVALGVRPSPARALGLVAIVAWVTTCLVLIGCVLTMLLGVPAPLAQAAAWCIWLTWLGVVFPKHRLLETARDCAKPYRLAFARDLLPGIGCNFALLLGPAVQGLVEGTRTPPPPPSLLAGGVLLLAGAALIGAGVHAIGIARIFFVYEYRAAGGPVMRGVYRVIRHPLFLGGELASVGLALCIGTPDALALAAVNLLVLPAYVVLEDRRSAKVMGDAYAGYRSATGAVVPRGRRR